MRTKHKQPSIFLSGPVSPFGKKTPAEIDSVFMLPGTAHPVPAGIVYHSLAEKYTMDFQRILPGFFRDFYEIKIKKVALVH